MPWNPARPASSRAAATLSLAAVLPLAAALLLAAAGCASAPHGAAPAAVAGNDPWKLYEEAVAAARVPLPEHVSRDLVPILAFTPGLSWDASGQKVLMATWTKAAYYDQRTPPYDYKIPDGVEVWLTAVPFLRQFCQRTGLAGQALTLRLAERLGLPPDAADDAFVEMWVDPHAFFRPCPDPEITDHECQVNLTAGPAAQPPSCPWSAALDGQLSGAFTAVTRAHLEWMCANWTKSYPPDQPRKSYPWTALGYTYDWGGRDHRGESEFVALPNTEVIVQSITKTEDYCAASSRP